MKVTIGDVLNIAHEVTDKTVADVFVYYSGHIKQLAVDFYVDGWFDGSRANSYKVYLERKTAQEEVDEILKRLVDMLPDQPDGSGDEVGA